jgi:dipeptidyl-peptidase-3
MNWSLRAVLLSGTLIFSVHAVRSRAEQAAERRYLVEQAGGIALIQLYADGFEKLTPRERVLLYHLAEAGIAGDPIYYDQVSPYGLELKRLLEGIWTHPQGIPPGVLEKIRAYTKLFWVHHGNYDSDSARKFVPEFTPLEFRAAARQALKSGANLGVKSQRALDERLKRLERAIFDANYRPVLTAKNPPPGQDILTASASNLYERVTLADLERFKARYPLNSRVVKRTGRVLEEVWRAGTPDGKIPPGRYAAHIRRIIENLERAAAVAGPPQAEALRKLIRYYQTGEKADWYAYNIAWLRAASRVDAINGFIEQYLDPRSEKGAFESVVTFVDAERTRLMRALAENAQYFEDRMPWREEYKKKGITAPVADVVTVVSTAGEGGPLTAAGLNLPNEQDIREQHGSKSILLANVSDAFAAAVGERAAVEFSSTEEELLRARRHRAEARNLLVAMHEVLGHASGKVSEKLKDDPRAYLKEYYSALEEARADLVALWHFGDAKLEELGVTDREEVMKAAYDGEVRGALVLLHRYPQGQQIEEDHDRGSQMIIRYLMERHGAVEPVTRDGKIFLRVTDYAKFRAGAGELLAELMRIKAEGDYDAIKKLMDTYGVRLNPEWRDQVQERARRIGLPRRGAFISPLIEPVRDSNGNVVDARLRYTQDFAEVMLTYSRKSLGYLPPQ